MPTRDKTRDAFQESFPCPYFKDSRIATYEYMLRQDMSQEGYAALLARGFRRSGIVYYRTLCRTCNDCLPLRIDTSRFVAGKSQRRTLRQNHDVQVFVTEKPFLNREKIDLYARYLCSKHGKRSSPNTDEPLQSLIDLHYGYPAIIEMDYFLGSRLVAVGIVDAADNALSANYFYYDTGHLDRRPGIFSILREIALAGTLGRRFYYLGFYIEGTRKMSYKKSFRPNQAFRDGVWTDFLE